MSRRLTRPAEVGHRKVFVAVLDVHWPSGRNPDGRPGGISRAASIGCKLREPAPWNRPALASGQYLTPV
jgi:hypothetical protein